MFIKTETATETGHKRLRPSRLFAVGAVALLAGCSSVPDAINPVEWYKGARDAIVGDDETAKAPADPKNELQAQRGQPAPGADGEIPNLNTVPERPTVSTRAEREALQRGLVADRAGAREYSSEVVRRQGDAVNPLQVQPQTAARQAPAPVVTPSAPRAPVPPAQPKPPVATAPVPAPTPPAPRVAPAPPQMAAVPPATTQPERRTLRPVARTSTPRLSPVPPSRGIGGGFETVVVSSSGVQTVNSAGFQATRASFSPAPALAARSGSTVSGVRSLAEFNPAAARGSYQVATILFGKGSSKLSARDRSILRQVLAQARQTGGTIRIIGHASSRTQTMDVVRHKLVNFQVSSQRADAVARELVRLGAPPQALFVGAVADREPRYQESMPTGEAGNRRTEIFIDF